MTDEAKKLWEISNPSDAYTIRGEFLVAAVAVLCLGEGKYGLHPEKEGDRELPVFLLGGADWWIKENLGGDFAGYIEAHAMAIAEALESVTIGDFEDRARLERLLACISSPTERAAAQDAWHDQRRSSMNDIGKRAKQMAAHLRNKAKGG